MEQQNEVAAFDNRIRAIRALAQAALVMDQLDDARRDAPMNLDAACAVLGVCTAWEELAGSAFGWRLTDQPIQVAK